jgi:hypothetical protein
MPKSRKGLKKAVKMKGLLPKFLLLIINDLRKEIRAKSKHSPRKHIKAKQKLSFPSFYSSHNADNVR